MTDLSDPVAPHNAPAEAGLDALVAYWQGLCRGAMPPRRTEIDPRRIGAVLPDTFVLERVAPGLARFRVAGARVSALMGMDVRGMPISCLIEPAARESFACALARLFEEPMTLRLRLGARGGPGRPALTGRMVLLPLCSDLGDVSRVLGCVVTAGAIGHAPRRFALEALSAPTALTMPAPARPALRGERPWLRLVVSDGIRLSG